MRERHDEIGGRRVRSLEAGGGDHTVVLVPGLGAVGYMKDVMAGCSAWARTFLLDVPGFGHRPPRPCAPEVAAIAELVGEWLRVVPGGPVVLAGHSSGAQVALRVAASAPERVRALALLSPTFPPRQRSLPRMVPPFLGTALHEPLGVLAATVPYYVRGGPAAVLRFIRSAQADTPEYVIGRVGCPVLVARGVLDRLCPKPWADGLAITAPRGRSVAVPGAHAFPFRHGGLTASLIAELAAQAPIRPSSWRSESPPIVLPSMSSTSSPPPGPGV